MVILSSPSKNCESEPIHTDLLKAILIVILKSTHRAFQQITSNRDFSKQPQGGLSKITDEEDHPRADRQELSPCVKPPIHWKDTRMNGH